MQSIQPPYPMKYTPPNSRSPKNCKNPHEKPAQKCAISAKVRLVRRPGFQFGGGLHQRKRGIANKTVTGKNLLGREKTLRRNKGGRTYADESMPPSKKGQAASAVEDESHPKHAK